MKRPIRRCFARTGFARTGFVAAILVTWTCSLFATEPIPQGVHGGATEIYQLRALETLPNGRPISEKITDGINPDYGDRFIPEDAKPSEDATVNAARIALGKKLYFEPKLSRDHTVSCATCHDVTRGFADALATSEGVDLNGKKQFGTRNSPTTMNVALYHTLFWDGRSPSLEHQARQPIINPVEMGMPDDERVIIAGIKEDPEYKALFKKAYNASVNYKNIGDALAAFERTLVFMDNPFFASLRGEGLADDALAGWELFNGHGRCASCHALSPTNPIFSDNKFHNIGVAARHHEFDSLAVEAVQLLAEDTSDAKLDELALSTDFGELGRFMVTKNVSDIGAFRTPMLLNVGITAPYMHDGSMATLWDTVDHYNKGGEPHRYLDGGIEPLALTDEEVDQLVAFLFALTDVRFAEQNRAEFLRQKMLAADARPFRDEKIAERKTLSFESPLPVATEKGASR